LLDSGLRINILEQLNNLAAFLTKEYGLTGVNGVDFILNGDRVYLTEVNPRYSASMELIEQAYTLPIFYLHTQAVMDGILPKFNLKELLRNSHSCALWRTRRCVKINPIICEDGSPDPSDREVAYPDGSGEPSSQSLVCYSRSRKFFGKVILFAEREAIMPDTRGWAAKDIRDIPEPGEKIPAGGPICTVLANGTTYNEVVAGLSDRAKELKEEIYGKTECDPDNRTFNQTGYRDFDWKGTARIPGSH
jgi:predicted ATP-grasp superfamily ATP-dependent carboligase